MFYFSRFRLKNQKDTNLRLSLVNKYTLIENIDWFVMDPNSDIEHTASGQFAKLDPNDLPSRFPKMTLYVKPGQIRDIYSRIQSDTIVILPLRVMIEAEWQGAATIDIMSLSLLIGCLFTMAAFGFVFFTAFRRHPLSGLPYSVSQARFIFS